MIKVFNKSKRPIFIAGVQILPKESFTWVDSMITPDIKNRINIQERLGFALVTEIEEINDIPESIEEVTNNIETVLTETVEEVKTKSTKPKSKSKKKTNKE